MAKPKLSFTDLPQNVRVKIYIMAGLVRPCPIDIRKEGIRHTHRKSDQSTHRLAGHGRMQEQRSCCYERQANDRSFMPTDLKCFCLAIPLQLIYLCRSIHDEVLSIFYGQNKFRFTWIKFGGLQLLRKLSPIAFASMTSLHVFLYRSPGTDLSVKSLIASPSEYQDLRALCERIAQFVPELQMRFRFTCIPTDVKMGRQIARALQLLPVMKDCAISFGSIQDMELKRLVQDTGRYLLGAGVVALEAPKTPFPFEKLPMDIRSLVLRHTDLVARYVRVRWEPDITDELRIHDGKLVCRRGCCAQCSNYGEGCFCSSGRAAFSTTCVCYQFPTAIFLVNRMMCHEARKIFLSQNRFVVTGEMALTEKFLSSQNDWLSRLRKIDFGFNNSQVLRWISDSSNCDPPRWQELVGLIESHCSLPTLEVSLDAGDHWLYNRIAKINKLKYGLRLTQLYRQIINPWRKVKGLLKFHVLFEGFEEYDGVPEVLFQYYEQVAFPPKLKADVDA